MIHSMTAYARLEHQNKLGTFIWELRSINHRYLDLNLRLPENLRSIEMDVRSHVSQGLNRGKVDVTLSYQASPDLAIEINLNKSLVAQLVKASEAIQQQSTTPGAIDPVQILRWPGAIQLTETDLSTAAGEILDVLSKTVDDLIKARHREGDVLKDCIMKRIDSAEIEAAKITKRLPDIMQAMRDKLQEKITDAEVKVDPNRFEQEIVFLLQKSDVAEELDRLNTHLTEVRQVLTKGGVAGRRLDFLMQELNREVNTLGAKAIDAETTSSVVELKVLIEQMREQIQNIE